MSMQGEPNLTDFFSGGDGGQQQSNDESLLSGYLSKIPDEDRAIVEKYAKDWDANVTRRFQDIHQRYEPYKNLGDYEDLVRFRNVATFLQENPQEVHRMLTEALGQQNSGGAGSGSEEEDWGDLPPAVVAKLKQMDQTEPLLKSLAEAVIGLKQSSQQQTEDQQLSSYVDALHEQYGDFDDRYVLSLMLSGLDGDSAVQEFFEITGQNVQQQQQRQPFTVLSGAGAVGQQGQFDPKKATSNDTRALVAAMLAASSQNQG